MNDRRLPHRMPAWFTQQGGNSTGTWTWKWAPISAIKLASDSIWKTYINIPNQTENWPSKIPYGVANFCLKNSPRICPKSGPNSIEFATTQSSSSPSASRWRRWRSTRPARSSSPRTSSHSGPTLSKLGMILRQYLLKGWNYLWCQSFCKLCFEIRVLLLGDWARKSNEYYSCQHSKSWKISKPRRPVNLIFRREWGCRTWTVSGALYFTGIAGIRGTMIGEPTEKHDPSLVFLIRKAIFHKCRGLRCTGICLPSNQRHSNRQLGGMILDSWLLKHI